MRKLLLIAYYFPPDGGAGSQRPAKFSQYLPDFGWQVTVLTRTIRPLQDRGRWDPADDSGFLDIERVARVTRVSCFESDDFSDWPQQALRTDPSSKWLTPAYREARAIIHAGDADAVLITMSPFWLSHLGERLQRQTGVPVIYDLRDPWALDGWQPMRTCWHWRREMQLMRRTLERANGVIANTPEAGGRMLRSFPAIMPSRLTVITNGYDASDFVAAKDSSRSVPHRGSDEFLLVHTGTLHGEALYPSNGIKALIKHFVNYYPERIVASGRTTRHLFGAIRILQKLESDLVGRVRLVLVGQADPGTLRCIEESGIANQVTCTGYLDHARSVSWLRAADALFLPLHGLPVGQRSLIVPGKMYEYLASGKPILGCVPEGDARDWLQASGMGYLAGPTDDEEIAASLHRLLKDWKAGNPKCLKAPSWIALFERRNLAARMAKFLETTVSRLAPNRRAGESKNSVSREFPPVRLPEDTPAERIS